MTLRVGILGCARIAPLALVRPARALDDVRVVAVGSRSLQRAQRFAKRHRIPRAYGSYDEVLADPQVDAVYNPLPNALHAAWTLHALDQGKHVLCEKPLAANEAEAQRMADAARRSSLVAMEAFHYRYHPLASRLSEIVGSGELGELRGVEISMSVPLLLPWDIRWSATLAGGATMDLGCYAVNLARFLVPGEPEVLTAAGSLTRRGVDRNYEATLGFPRGVEATLRGSLVGPPWGSLEVRGTRGSLSVFNPFMPQLYYRLKVSRDGSERGVRVPEGHTYRGQLAVFAAAVRGEAPVPTDFDDAVANTRVLDTIRSIIGVKTAGRGGVGERSAKAS